MTLGEDRFRRADEIFDAALDLPPEERAAFLDEQCGDDAELRALVARLLRETGTVDDLLGVSPAGGGPLLDSLGEDLDDEPSREGMLVDRYRIVREVGRGGMAVVYLAERADGQFEQQVALKLVKRGIDTDEVIRRFAQERQIMALARHPNIARLLDGGATEDGRPYFVMEYVDGQPLDEYADEQELPLRDRLRLFLRVADAVSYAHRNLVVHRDIKPSNILVTPEGDVKLLDFGIARYLADDEVDATRTRGRFMTPAYASPEQISGEPVTTASDIYQLGLLLYRLLTGASPYRVDTTLPEALRQAICEQLPQRPSQSGGLFGRELAGDLDTIVLTALRKEPDRRYPSVAQLTDDIDRYLTGRPVTARPDTLAYRTSKFVRRHKIAAAFAGFAFLSLLAVTVTVSVQAGRIARERDRANRQAETAERVSEFLVGLFEISDPFESPGETVTAREVLDQGAERIRDELEDQPVVRATLMDTIGRVYQNLGLYDSAGSLLTEALELRRAELGDDDLEVAQSLNNVAWLEEQRGNFDEAEPLYREALRLRREQLDARDPQIAASLNNLALLLYRKAEFEEADRLHMEALDIRREVFGEDSVQISDSLNNLGLLAYQRGDYERAEELHRQSLDIRRRRLGDGHPAVAISLGNLGMALRGQGDLEAAEPLFREALEIRQRAFGDVHPAVAESLNNLAALLYGKGDFAAAEPVFRRVVELDRQTIGEDHPDYANSLNNLAMIMMRKGDHESAADTFRDAIARMERAIGKDHWLTGLARSNLGAALTELERFQEAERTLLAARETLEASLGADHDRTKTADERLAALYERWER